MFITIITEGGLDFDAVTIRLWNVLVFAHGMNRSTIRAAPRNSSKRG